MAVRFGYEQPSEALPLCLVFVNWHIKKIGIDIKVVHFQYERHAQFFSLINFNY